MEWKYNYQVRQLVHGADEVLKRQSMTSFRAVKYSKRLDRREVTDDHMESDARH
jgi:hypothetical protein